MLTMLSADYASASVKNRSDTIRGLQAPRGVQYFFSLMQFFGTSAALMGHRRLNSVIYYNLFVVQVTPFIMTLRRKNLVSHNFNVFLYGCMLVYGVNLGFKAVLGDAGVLRLMACLAALWRMGPFPLKNKYFIWTTMFILLQHVFRPVMTRHPDALFDRFYLMDASDILTIVAVVYGFYYHFFPKKETTPKVVKVE